MGKPRRRLSLQEFVDRESGGNMQKQDMSLEQFIATKQFQETARPSGVVGGAAPVPGQVSQLQNQAPTPVGASPLSTPIGQAQAAVPETLEEGDAPLVPQEVSRKPVGLDTTKTPIELFRETELARKANIASDLVKEGIISKMPENEFEYAAIPQTIKQKQRLANAVQSGVIDGLPKNREELAAAQSDTPLTTFTEANAQTTVQKSAQYKIPVDTKSHVSIGEAKLKMDAIFEEKRIAIMNQYHGAMPGELSREGRQKMKELRQEMAEYNNNSLIAFKDAVTKELGNDVKTDQLATEMYKYYDPKAYSIIATGAKDMFQTKKTESDKLTMSLGQDFQQIEQLRNDPLTSTDPQRHALLNGFIQSANQKLAEIKNLDEKHPEVREVELTELLGEMHAVENRAVAGIGMTLADEKKVVDRFMASKAPESDKQKVMKMYKEDEIKVKKMFKFGISEENTLVERFEHLKFSKGERLGGAIENVMTGTYRGARDLLGLSTQKEQLEEETEDRKRLRNYELQSQKFIAADRVLDLDEKSDTFGKMIENDRKGIQWRNAGYMMAESAGQLAGQYALGMGMGSLLGGAAKATAMLGREVGAGVKALQGVRGFQSGLNIERGLAGLEAQAFAGRTAASKLAAAETAEIAGTLTAAERTKNIVSTIVPAYLMSYDQNLKQSYQLFGVAEPWKNQIYAQVTSLLEGATEMIHDPFSQIKGLKGAAFADVKSNVKDFLKGVTKEEFDNMSEGLKKTLIKDAVKNIALKSGRIVGGMTQEGIEEVASTVGEFFTSQILDPSTVEDRNLGKEVADTFMQTFVGMGFTAFAGAGMVGQTRRILNGKHYKDAILGTGRNEKMALAYLDKLKADGQITEQEYKEKKEFVVASGIAYKNMPKINYVTGNALTNDDQSNYMFARVNEIRFDNMSAEAAKDGNVELFEQLGERKKKFTDLKKAATQAGDINYDTNGIPIAVIPQLPDKYYSEKSKAAELQDLVKDGNEEIAKLYAEGKDAQAIAKAQFLQQHVNTKVLELKQEDKDTTEWADLKVEQSKQALVREVAYATTMEQLEEIQQKYPFSFTNAIIEKRKSQILTKENLPVDKDSATPEQIKEAEMLSRHKAEMQRAVDRANTVEELDRIEKEYLFSGTKEATTAKRKKLAEREETAKKIKEGEGGADEVLFTKDGDQMLVFKDLPKNAEVRRTKNGNIFAFIDNKPLQDIDGNDISFSSVQGAKAALDKKLGNPQAEVEDTTPTSVEEKKADIEKRREKELADMNDMLQHRVRGVLGHVRVAKKYGIKLSFKEKNIILSGVMQDTIVEEAKKVINAKYDAELAKLEPKKEETKKEEKKEKTDKEEGVVSQEDAELHDIVRSPAGKYGVVIEKGKTTFYNRYRWFNTLEEAKEWKGTLLTLHKEAKDAEVNIETKQFAEDSKKLTGKEHLDDMTLEELNVMRKYIPIESARQKETTEIAKKDLTADLTEVNAKYNRQIDALIPEKKVEEKKPIEEKKLTEDQKEAAEEKLSGTKEYESDDLLITGTDEEDKEEAEELYQGLGEEAVTTDETETGVGEEGTEDYEGGPSDEDFISMVEGENGPSDETLPNESEQGLSDEDLAQIAYAKEQERLEAEQYEGITFSTVQMDDRAGRFERLLAKIQRRLGRIPELQDVKDHFNSIYGKDKASTQYANIEADWNNFVKSLDVTEEEDLYPELREAGKNDNVTVDKPEPGVTLPQQPKVIRWLGNKVVSPFLKFAFKNIAYVEKIIDENTKKYESIRIAELHSADILDWRKYPKGTKFTVKINPNGNIYKWATNNESEQDIDDPSKEIVPFEKEGHEEGSQKWLEDVPMEVYDEAGNRVEGLFIHSPNWYNEVNVANDIENQQEVIDESKKITMQLRRDIYEAWKQGKDFQVKIVDKSLGRIEQFKKGEKLPSINENNPTAKIGFVTGVGKTVVAEGKQIKAENIVGIDGFAPGDYIELRQIDENLYIALTPTLTKYTNQPVVNRTLQSVFASFLLLNAGAGIKNMPSVKVMGKDFTLQNAKDLAAQFKKKYSLDLANAQNVNDYMRMFTKLENQVRDRDTMAPNSVFAVFQQGTLSVYHNIKSKNTKQLLPPAYLNGKSISDLADPKSKKTAKEIQEIFDQMFLNIQGINNNIMDIPDYMENVAKKLPIVEEVLGKPTMFVYESPHTGKNTYYDFLKDNMTTDTKSWNTGTTTEPFYVTMVQPSIQIGRVDEETVPMSLLNSEKQAKQETDEVKETVKETTAIAEELNKPDIEQEEFEKQVDEFIKGSIDILEEFGLTTEGLTPDSFQTQLHITEEQRIQLTASINSIPGLSEDDKHDMENFMLSTIFKNLNEKFGDDFTKEQYEKEVNIKFADYFGQKLDILRHQLSIMDELVKDHPDQKILNLRALYDFHVNNFEIIEKNWNTLRDDILDIEVNNYVKFIEIEFDQNDTTAIKDVGNENEGDWEREGFTENYKDKASLFLKRFLFTIPNMRNGEVKKGFMGVPTFNRFEDNYNILMELIPGGNRILSNSGLLLDYLKSNVMPKPYQDFAKEVVKIIEPADNAPQHQKELAEQFSHSLQYAMTKSNVVMKMVLQKMTKSGGTKMQLMDINANAVTRTLITQWEANHGVSDLINEDDTINSTVRQKIIDSIDAMANKAEFTKEDYEEFATVLESMGILMDSQAIRELVNTGYYKYDKENQPIQVKGKSLFTDANGTFFLIKRHLERTKLAEKEIKKVGDNDDLNFFKKEPDVVRRLAKINKSYMGFIPSQSFRDAENSIYGYEDMMMDKQGMMKLKDEGDIGKGYRKAKLNTIFDKHSYILKLMDQHQPIREFTDLTTCAITSIKVEGKDPYGSAEVKDLPDVDYERLALALISDDSLQLKGIKTEEGLSLRLISTLGLTSSDKKRKNQLSAPGLDLKSGHFDLDTISIAEGDEGDKIKRFLYSQIVKPELERIILHHQEARIQGKHINRLVNQKDYNLGAQMFIMFPILNTLKVGENGQLLLDYLSELPLEKFDINEIENLIKDQALDMIAEDIHVRAAEKAEKWLSSDYFYKEKKLKVDYSVETEEATKEEKDKDKPTPTKVIKSVDTKYLGKFSADPVKQLRAAALDYIINSTLINANMYMMFSGDVANFAPDGKFEKYFEKDANGNVLVNKPKKDTSYADIVKETIGVNLGKRLAMLIAPGSMLSNSIGDTYIQILAQDANRVADNIHDIIKLFYGETKANNAQEQLDILQATNEIMTDEIAKHNLETPRYKEAAKAQKEASKKLQNSFPKIKAYFDIESTDAQEYTTWKEHLDIILRQGRISRKNYDRISHVLENNLELTNQDKEIIFQPIKPVFTGTVSHKGTGDLTRSRTLYIKSSSFPLIPQLTKGSELDKLRLEMERIQKDTNKNVRLSYGTANKVGATSAPVKLWKADKSFNERAFQDINFEQVQANESGAALLLNRENFRIQQDVPFKSNKTTQDKISIGSQMMKILFSNDVKEIIGEDLYNHYQDSFITWSNAERDKLYEELAFDPNAKEQSTETIIRIKQLLKEEAQKRNYTKQDIDVLSNLLDDNTFVIPLWLSSNSNRYEAFVNSIVAGRLIDLKLPGTSSVLASEEGFIQKYQEAVANDRMVYTDKWNGVLQANQVLLPSKFRDNNGKLIDLSSNEWSEVDKRGIRRLKKSKINAELLDLTSFRIPTSSHVSGSQMEIVGFLPGESGDLAIYPKQLTKQKGFDFDVDKEYTYWLHHYIDSEGTLVPLDKHGVHQSIDELNELLQEERYNSLEEMDKDNHEDYLIASRIIDNIFGDDFKTNATRDLKGLKKIIKKKLDTKLAQNEVIRVHSKVFGSTDPRIKRLVQAVLSTDFAEEQAALIDSVVPAPTSSFTILSDEYQKSKMNLGSAGKTAIGVYSNYVTWHGLAQQTSKPIALMDMVKDEKGKTIGYEPTEITIGNLKSDGAFGKKSILQPKNMSIKIWGQVKRTISEAFAERQNTGTDNEKLQVLGRVGVNNNTINVDALMAALGFDIDVFEITEDQRLDNDNSVFTITEEKANGEKEDKHYRSVSIPYLLLSQPIVKEYVEALKNSNSQVSDFDIDKKKKLKDDIIGRYGGLEINDKLTAGDRKELTGETLFNNLSSSDDRIQQVALELFLELQEMGEKMQVLQSHLNIQREGLGRSFYDAESKYENLLSLAAGEAGDKASPYSTATRTIANVDSFVGEFMDKNKWLLDPNREDYDEWVDIGNNIMMKPTTFSGIMMVNSTKVYREIFRQYFPQQSTTLNGMVDAVLVDMGKDALPSKNKVDHKHDIIKEVKRFISSYVFSHIDVKKERDRLMFDDDDKHPSLARYLYDLKNSEYGEKNVGVVESNALLSQFDYDFGKDGNPSIIKYRNSRGEDIQEEYKYQALIKLLHDNKELPDFNGQPYNTTKLALDLITYSYLTGGVQEAIEFIKYIPVKLLSATGIDSKLRDVHNKLISNKVDVFAEMFGKDGVRFKQQFFQHNPSKAIHLEIGKITKFKDADGKATSTFGIDTDEFEIKADFAETNPNFLTIYNSEVRGKGKARNQLYKKVVDGSRIYYKRLPLLGVFGMSEYDPKALTATSLIHTEVKTPAPLKPDPVAQLPKDTNSQTNPFNTMGLDLKEILDNISDAALMNGTSALAIELKQFIDPTTKIEITEEVAVGDYTAANNTIRVNPDNLNNKEELAAIIMKEYAHSITARELFKYYTFDGTNSYRKPGTQLPLHVQKLDRLYTEISRVFADDPDFKRMIEKYKINNALKPGEKYNPLSTGEFGAYGGLNIFEMTSEIFANPQFQKKLGAIKYKDTDQTLAQKFYEIIGEIMAVLKFNKILLPEAQEFANKNSTLLGETINATLLFIEVETKERLINQQKNPNIQQEKAAAVTVPKTKPDPKPPLGTQKYELFPGVFANDDQHRAIDDITAFLDSDKDVYLLEGRAGTGKTTIIKKAVKGRSGVIGGTIAHEAKGILQENLPNKKTYTIASMLGLKKVKGGGYRERTDKEEFEFRRANRKDPIENANIIIIDEASMIDTEMYERLLAKKPAHAKIIFMGDNAQIPPIDSIENKSPVFDISDSSKLSERMRQGKQSPILDIGDKYVENVEKLEKGEQANKDVHGERKDNFNEETNEGVKFSNDWDATFDEFVKDFQTAPNNLKNAIIITATNARADYCNEEIRNRLYDTPDAPYVIGETIRINNSHFVNEELKIANGTRAKVTDVAVVGSIDGYTYYELKINAEIVNEQGQREIKQETIRTINPKHNVKKIINEKKNAAYKLSGLERDEALDKIDAFEEAIVDVGYNYAITTHKVQGSTYNIAYVMEDNIMSFPGGELQNNRMMYTAVSRPSKKLVIFNPNKEIDNKTEKDSIDPNESESPTSIDPTDVIPEDFEPGEPDDSSPDIDDMFNSAVGDKLILTTGKRPEQNKPESINIYSGSNENADLSNFATRPFIYDSDEIGVSYKELTGKDLVLNNVESAFQVSKLLNASQDYWINPIDDWSNPQLSPKGLAVVQSFIGADGPKAKYLGSKIQGLDTEAWDDISDIVMKDAIYESFKQNPQAAERLISTGNAELTHTQDKTKWAKEFPRVLMEVRDELRDENVKTKEEAKEEAPVVPIKSVTEEEPGEPTEPPVDTETEVEGEPIGPVVLTTGKRPTPNQTQQSPFHNEFQTQAEREVTTIKGFPFGDDMMKRVADGTKSLTIRQAKFDQTNQSGLYAFAGWVFRMQKVNEQPINIKYLLDKGYSKETILKEFGVHSEDGIFDPEVKAWFKGQNERNVFIFEKLGRDSQARFQTQQVETEERRGFPYKADIDNLAKRSFKYEGKDLPQITFPSVEHALQHAKIGYSDPIVRQPLEVQDMLYNPEKYTPEQAREIGKKITGLGERWDNNSSRIMRDLITQSFKQNPGFLYVLLETGDSKLMQIKDKETRNILLDVRRELKDYKPKEQTYYERNPELPESIEFLEKELGIQYDNTIEYQFKIDKLLDYAQRNGNAIQQKLAKILRNKLRIEGDIMGIGGFGERYNIKAYGVQNTENVNGTINLGKYHYGYDLKTPFMTFNLAAYTRFPVAEIKKKLANTINHEIIHHFTIAELRNDPVFEKKINNLYNVAVEHNKKTGNAYYYGLTNTKEFVTEALSNGQFQAFLQTIPYGTTEKTVWKKFMDIITELYKKHGLGVDNTLLKEAVNVITKQISINDSYLYTRRHTGIMPEEDEWIFSTIPESELGKEELSALQLEEQKEQQPSTFQTQAAPIEEEEQDLKYNPSTFYTTNPPSNPQLYPVGELVAYRALKKQTLYNINNKIVTVNAELRKHKNRSVERDNLEAKKKDLEKQKSELQADIKDLEKDMTKSVQVLHDMVQRDLERADRLSKSDSPEDTDEAAEISRFIEAICEFNPDRIKEFGFENNPFFSEEEIKQLLPSEVQIFNEWSVKAAEILTNIANKNNKILEDLAGNISNIEKMYGKKLTHKELKQAIKDTDLLSMYVMSVKNGIFSHNGLLPQIAFVYMNKEMEHAAGKHRVFKDRLENLTPKVEKEMRDKGKIIKGGWINFKASVVDWSMFFQKDENGMFGQGAALVQRYTSDYHNERERIFEQSREMYRQGEMEPDPIKKMKIHADAFGDRNKWIRNNEIIINPAKLSAIRNEIGQGKKYEGVYFDQFHAKYTDAQAKQHEDEIKKLIGDEEFNEKVKEMIEYLDDFIAYRRRTIDEMMIQDKVTDPKDLTEANKAKLKRYTIKENPFYTAEYTETNKPQFLQGIRGAVPVYPSISNLVSIPKKEEHYDKNYKEIQANPIFKEYYDLSIEQAERMHATYPYEIQNRIATSHINYMGKTFKEALLSAEGTFLYKLFAPIRAMLNDFLQVFGVDHSPSVTHAHHDYITGESNYTVNNNFITKHLREIQATKAREISIFKEMSGLKDLKKVDPKLLNVESLQQLERIVGKTALLNYLTKDVINVYKIMDAYAHHQKVMASSLNLPKMLETYSNVTTQYEAKMKVLPIIKNIKNHYNSIKLESTNDDGTPMSVAQVDQVAKKEYRERGNKQFESWFNRFILDNQGRKSKFLPIRKRQLEDYATELEKSMSGKGKKFDITKQNKSIKTASESQEMKDIVKQLYEPSDIQKKTLPQADLDKIRADKKARAEEILLILGKRPAARTPKEAVTLGKNAHIEILLKRQLEMGRTVSAGSIWQGIMKGVTLKLLALNPSTAAMNFAQGQISNAMTAEKGDYFRPENIGEVTPADLIHAGIMARTSGLSKNQVDKTMNIKIWKLYKIIDRYDVFADIANDIQHSSSENIFDSFTSKILMSPTRYTEFLNQAPLIAAILKDQMIIGKKLDANGNAELDANGKEIKIQTDLLDSIDRVPTAQGYEVRMKPEYDTPENRARVLRDFGQLTDDVAARAASKEYYDLKGIIDQAIEDTHGDYNKRTGMMAKDYAIGQTFTSMKTWLPRQLYIRLGTEQNDIIAGIKGFKGYMRSHTNATALLAGLATGALTGGVGMGLVGGLLFAGANRVSIWQKWGFGALPNEGILADIAVTCQLLLKKFIGVPTNIVSMTVKPFLGKYGKNVPSQWINTYSDDVLYWGTNKNGKKGLVVKNASTIMVGDNFTDRDFKNFKANLRDLSYLTIMYMSYALIKMYMMPDEDDERLARNKKAKEELKKKKAWYNAFINKAMQMIEQATMFYNMYELVDTGVSSPMIKFFYKDVYNFIHDVGNLAFGDAYKDVARAPHAGESKAWLSTSKLISLSGLSGLTDIFEGEMPSLGFESAAERQWKKGGLDELFWSPEKVAEEKIAAMRRVLKAKLADDERYKNKTDGQLDAIVRKRIPYRTSSRETYQRNLERIKKMEERRAKRLGAERYEEEDNDWIDIAD